MGEEEERLAGRVPAKVRAARRQVTDPGRGPRGDVDEENLALPAHVVVLGGGPGDYRDARPVRRGDRLGDVPLAQRVDSRDLARGEIEQAQPLPRPALAVDLGIVALLDALFLLLRFGIDREQRHRRTVGERLGRGDPGLPARAPRPPMHRQLRPPVGQRLRLAAIDRNAVELKDVPLDPIGAEVERLAIRRPPGRAVLRRAGGQLAR